MRPGGGGRGESGEGVERVSWNWRFVENTALLLCVCGRYRSTCSTFAKVCCWARVPRCGGEELDFSVQQRSAAVTMGYRSVYRSRAWGRVVSR